MKLVLQVAAGVLLALLAYEGFRRYQAQRDLQDAAELLNRLSADMPRLMAPPSGRAPRSPVLGNVARTRLEPGQACVSAAVGKPGTIIVRGVVNGVPQVVQLLEHGRPVSCLGEHRL